MAKRRKSKQRRQPPVRAVLLTACDSASRDPGTGKVTLYGLFDIIWAKEFPTTFRPFVLFAQLAGHGKYPIAVELRTPNGRVEKLAEIEVECKPRAFAVIEATLAGLNFKRPGDYQLAVTCRRRDLHEPKTIQVRQAPPKK
jgi:hypothetical protein